jgi:hypothetical protein
VAQFDETTFTLNTEAAKALTASPVKPTATASDKT